MGRGPPGVRGPHFENHWLKQTSRKSTKQGMPYIKTIRPYVPVSDCCILISRTQPLIRTVKIGIETADSELRTALIVQIRTYLQIRTMRNMHIWSYLT